MSTKPTKPTACNTCISGMDKIGEPVGFSVQGRSTFKTKLGGCLTVLYTIITLLYVADKGLILFQRLGSSYSQSIFPNFFDQSNVISSVQKEIDKFGNVTNSTGFNVAFGVFTSDLKPLKNF